MKRFKKTPFPEVSLPLENFRFNPFGDRYQKSAASVPFCQNIVRFV